MPEPSYLDVQPPLSEPQLRQRQRRVLSLDVRVTKLEAIIEILCAEIVRQSKQIAVLSAPTHRFPRELEGGSRNDQVRALSLDLRVTKLEAIVEILRSEIVRQSKQIAILSAPQAR